MCFWASKIERKLKIPYALRVGSDIAFGVIKTLRMYQVRSDRDKKTSIQLLHVLDSTDKL